MGLLKFSSYWTFAAFDPHPHILLWVSLSHSICDTQATGFPVCSEGSFMGSPSSVFLLQINVLPKILSLTLVSSHLSLLSELISFVWFQPELSPKPSALRVSYSFLICLLELSIDYISSTSNLACSRITWTEFITFPAHICLSTCVLFLLGSFYCLFSHLDQKPQYLLWFECIP